MELTLEIVNFYIDGLNLYNGLKSAGLRKYCWLNLEELSKLLLKPNQKLNQIKYFTSIVYPDNNLDNYGLNKYMRQSRYLKALKTLDSLEIILGRHQENIIQCNNCGHATSKYNEKMTDVKIAVEMLKDTFQKNCTTQILITGDTDLVPVTEAIYNLSGIKLIIFAPPYRRNDRLKKYCHFYGKLFTGYITNSQFPNIVINKAGYKIFKPIYWGWD